jgi:hypothetical protein
VRLALRAIDQRRSTPGERLLPIIYWFKLLQTDRAAAATFLKAHWVAQDATMKTESATVTEQLADIESVARWLPERYRGNPALPTALDALHHRRAALQQRVAALPGTDS